MNGCGKILIEDYSGNIHGECGEDGLCPACAEKLEARVRELEAWKRDTEESWRITLEDRGAHDEMHCSCVPVLRERVRELERENERLRAALEAVPEWIPHEEYPDPYPWEDHLHFCQWCHSDRQTGHAPDCQRQRALRGEG